MDLTTLTALLDLLDVAERWDHESGDLDGMEKALICHHPVPALTARGRARQLTDCADDLRDWIRKQVQQ